MAYVHHVLEDVGLKGGEDFVGRDRLAGGRSQEVGAEDGGIAFGADAFIGEVFEVVG
jgi:hypothetical protein